MTSYSITNAADIAAVGLPKYALGTWAHYTTSGDGWVRLGRITGKGCKFMSVLAADFEKMVAVGLAVALDVQPSFPFPGKR